MEEAHAAFKESDRNNSGYIDYVELRGLYDYANGVPLFGAANVTLF